MVGHRQLLLALSIGAFAFLHIVQVQPDQQGICAFMFHILYFKLKSFTLFHIRFFLAHKE